MRNQKVTIESEMKRRMELIEDKAFRTMCVEVAKEIGISATEWNKNKVYYMLLIANKTLKMQEC